MNCSVVPSAILQFAVVMLLSVPFESIAQQSDTHSVSRRVALEEVIVTAQKKEESLQDAPISLAAFGYDDLEKEGISNIGDLGAKVPNLDITPFPTNNTTLRLYIRGVGVNDVQITQDPSIGVYADGIYIARSTGLALDVADLERIEVLRGPQGTLYGRNSTGGAINIVTRKPSTDALEFRQVVSLGNRDLLRAKSTINVPVTESFAFKVGYLHYQQDGFVSNSGPGDDYGDKESDGLRIDALWQLNSDITLQYGYDFSEFDAVNYNYQSVLPKDAASPVPSRQRQLISATGIAASQFSERRASSLQAPVAMRQNNTEIFGHALTFTADFELLTFKSISAYRELTDVGYADLAGGAAYSSFDAGTPGVHYRLDQGVISFSDQFGAVFDLDQATVDLDHDQISQEFQFLGSINESTDYIVGLYYFKEHATEYKPLSHQASSSILREPPGIAPYSQRLVTLTGNQFSIDNEAWAVFAQSTWTPDFFDQRLHLTLGARHSEDQRKATRSSQQAVWLDLSGAGLALDVANSFGLPPSYGDLPDAEDKQWPSTGEGDYSNDSFTLVAAYDLSDDINVYATIAEGYKSGGFNTREPSSIDFSNGFGPETLTNYELGIKGEFFERRLRVNGAVFEAAYEDLQFGFLLDGSVAETNVFNAGEATIQGFELDLTAVISEGLVAVVSYGYLNPSYDEIIDPNKPEAGDQSHRYVFPQAAQHTYNIGLEYIFEPFSFGELSANLNYNWTDERAATSRIGEVYLESTPDDASSASEFRGAWIDDYGLLNARLTLSDMDLASGSFKISLWGKNLEDTDYEVSAISNLLHSDRSVIWGEPRTYGVDFTYDF